MATTKKTPRRSKKATSSVVAPKDVVKDLVDLKSELKEVEQEIIVAVKPVVKKVIPVLSSAKSIFLTLAAVLAARGMPLRVRVARAIIATWISVMVMACLAMMVHAGPVGWAAVGVVIVFLWAVLNVEE